MPPTCKTCKRPDIDRINEQIIRGVPSRDIALHIGLSHMSVTRHKDKCLDTMLNEFSEAKRQGLLKDVDEAKNRIVQLESTFAQDNPVQAQLVQRRFAAIDLEAKLTGAYVQAATNPQDAEITANAQTIANLIAKHKFTQEEAEAAVAAYETQVVEAVQ